MAQELVWTGFMTLDGIVDSPGGVEEGHPQGGWVLSTPFDEEAFSLKGEELAETSALMFGRRSYEAFAPVWNGSADHAAYQDLPKIVVSTSLDEADLHEDWGETRILRSTEEVAREKAGDGGAIFLHGSAELARRLGEAGLIDRYHLLLFPVTLGTGKRFLPTSEHDRQDLRLRDSAAYSNGVVKLVYDVGR
ncbi:MAG TPA: dihydrofolate reductase family protein [Candidatus Brachybacterium intestinipullorum]|uniref:Dihydrofolate reductase family protein n=1 Tax=Candidatus Brachybacterium intestinipullorum TaxID=2838512 RepID=A0A9D2Q2I2_9MICO|nr:dihydrofolate reductase family protein [Candidatus Brachybacterium intestinipullorum]